MEDRSIDVVSASSNMSTSTNSTSSIGSRKTSNFFPHFNHPSSYGSQSHPHSTSQSYSQIAGNGYIKSGSASNTPYLSQPANMVSAPITPLLNGSNKSTPLFNEYEFNQLDTSIWNNHLPRNSGFNNRPHSFAQPGPQPMPGDDFRSRFSSTDGLNSGNKWNQFQFQFDDMLDTNYNYTSLGFTGGDSISNQSSSSNLGYNNDMFAGFQKYDMNQKQELLDPNLDEDHLNQSILALDLDIDLGDEEPLTSPSYKATNADIIIDIPKAKTGGLNPNLIIEKFPEIFSSSFYKRNDNGYMFIKETNDELIKVNRLSTQADSDVTIEVPLYITKLNRLVNISIDQLYNLELFNDVKVIKRRANVLRRFKDK